jgi:hypothetical protein
MGDKGLHQISAGSAQSLRTAEIRGVRLNKSWIKIVLADQKAELIPEPGLAVA